MSNDTPDQLVIANNADLSGTSDVLDVILSGTQAQSRYVLATYAGTRTGQFDTLNVSGGTGTWTQDYSVPGQLAIVVPEPGTLGVIALALALGVTARRRPRLV